MTQDSIIEQDLAFEQFGLKAPILQALQEAGFKIASPIQKQAIPVVLAGHDVVAQAHTGTGKTAAFGLPALHLIHDNPGSQLLVLTPTRELASQVSDELFRLGRHLGIRTATICGGKSFRPQIEALQRGVQVIVATPGRLQDLLESDSLPDFRPAIVVLDEADEMLDMGFLEAIQRIFTFLPEKRQTLLFSATMPSAIQKLAHQILKKPIFISVTQKETTNKDIKQVYYVIREDERDDAILRLLDSEEPAKSIIFCRTKKDVDRLSTTLVANGYHARGLHGDMEQPQREEVIRHFRSEQIRVLVATDVAARGLSVSDVSHVFNYHLPFDPASYVHRIGRTGRAGNKGVASTFVTLREWREFQRYEKVTGAPINREIIPTLEDVKKLKRQKLVSRIQNQPLHQETELVLELMKEVDHSTLVSKFISFVLEQETIQGPDRIGVEPRGQERDTRGQRTDKFNDERRRANRPQQKFGKANGFKKEHDKGFKKTFGQKNRANHPSKVPGSAAGFKERTRSI
ncbi:DEAD/DEAH box helicase [Candidatus Protochlamydia amoebophila]|uniref:DEAD/DEAH box helicase n=1 Tax=Candidatus Protochlamydia amoebophila TaxID=362787 RepID=UPI001BC928E8|nr:DEAD/DEAH box helicase [Candidatus Protochlamydia amoebophila]